MESPKPFLNFTGSYHGLYAYQKAECVYDVTYYFVTHFLQRGDRTVDQMLQAARSGKQNIAEGVRDSVASKETEIKLINVALGSLSELLEDYRDYMRTRGLQQWTGDRLMKAREQCSKRNDSAYYRQQIEGKSDEGVANVAIILIYQTMKLLDGYFKRVQQKFVQNGGIREQMYRARRNHRDNS